MPARKTTATIARSNLATARVKKRISQKQLAEWVGVSLRHYRRLEATLDLDPEDPERARPTLAFLVNCSLALGVAFDKVAPTGWRETWINLNEERPIAPFPWERDEARQQWSD